jgi:hypothetical protein
MQRHAGDDERSRLNMPFRATRKMPLIRAITSPASPGWRAPIPLPKAPMEARLITGLFVPAGGAAPRLVRFHTSTPSVLLSKELRDSLRSE